MQENPTGFVKIYPQIEYLANSPDGFCKAKATSWYMVGPWILARCESNSGANPFYTELPWSMGVHSPISIDAESGKIFSAPTQDWRTDLFRRLWQNRVNKPVEITILRRSPVKNAILINCLYPWWGYAISLLWRINQLNLLELSKAGIGIIAIITPDMQWLLPPEIDEAWIVPVADLHANQWNETLDLKIHDLVATLDSCYIPRLFQPTRATAKQVEAYTGISTFPRNEWIDRLAEKPIVTFMYRPDRCWGAHYALLSKFHLSLQLFPVFLRRRILKVIDKYQLIKQKKNIVCLAISLQKIFGDIEFAIAGTSTEISFPEWFIDLRSDNPGVKSNRETALQCSRSHLLISVAGSHMVLPSAFSGGVLCLLPSPDWIDVQTCWMLTTSDPCEAQFLYRTLSVNNSPEEVTQLAASILLNYPIQHLAYHQSFAHPLSLEELELIRDTNIKRHSYVNKIKNNIDLHILRV